MRALAACGFQADESEAADLAAVRGISFADATAALLAQQDGLPVPCTGPVALSPAATAARLI